MDFGEQKFEIRESFSLLEKLIAMRFANDLLVGPTLVASCANNVQKSSN
jgi:hypothetical protein